MPPRLSTRRWNRWIRPRRDSAQASSQVSLRLRSETQPASMGPKPMPTAHIVSWAVWGERGEGGGVGWLVGWSVGWLVGGLVGWWGGVGWGGGWGMGDGGWGMGDGGGKREDHTLCVVQAGSSFESIVEVKF